MNFHLFDASIYDQGIDATGNLNLFDARRALRARTGDEATRGGRFLQSCCGDVDALHLHIAILQHAQRHARRVTRDGGTSRLIYASRPLTLVILDLNDSDF
jgi:hypothetical protein